MVTVMLAVAMAVVSGYSTDVSGAAPINVGNVPLGTLVKGHIHNRFTGTDIYYAYASIVGSSNVWQAVAAANGGPMAAGGSLYVQAVGAENLPSDLELLTSNLTQPPYWLCYSNQPDGASPHFENPTTLNGGDPVAVAQALLGAGGSVYTNSVVPAATQNYGISANWGATIYEGTGQVTVYEATAEVDIPVSGTPPVTTVSGVDDLWHRSPVIVALAATRSSGGSEVKSITCCVDGGSPTVVEAASTQVEFGAPADHSNDGAHILTVYATDLGNDAETAQQVVVKIDTTGPTTVARAAAGRKGRALKLRCLVRDALSPQASAVTLVIKNSHRRVVKRIRVGTRNASTWFTAKWRPKAPGRYTYQITARDLAGNRQVKAGRARIVVR